MDYGTKDSRNPFPSYCISHNLCYLNSSMGHRWTQISTDKNNDGDILPHPIGS